MEFVHEPRDILELNGRQIESASASSRSDDDSPKKFLSVFFRCCHAYGRMYRNAQNTQYVGRCPRCGAQVNATIGPGGTERRMFEAR